VIAYEPVWAIGTGLSATRAEAHETHALIRSIWSTGLGEVAGAKLRILYGGSVTPDNSADLLGDFEIDGALVGGASLKPHDFAKIVTAGALHSNPQ
jgi:triosephosphate isomerase